VGLQQDLAAHPAVIAIEIVLFLYFLLVNVIDFALIVASLRALPGFMKLNRSGALKEAVKAYPTPVSVLLPVYNEQEHVVSVIRSLLSMQYAQFEIIVINDGSTDKTLDTIAKEFQLIPVPEGRYIGLQTKPVHTVYRSKLYKNLRVLDKENGGKGDALNAGLNEARYPLILAADGDSLYAANTLEQMMQPFAEDHDTVGCGAAIRIMNDRKNLLVRFQIAEYLRAALNSRFAWAPVNGIMCISGACAMWKKDVVVSAGGYLTNTVWEDAEMTVRVHHYMRASGRPYRIAFVPEALCWTHAPETLGDLRRQRISWHRHITETVSRHRTLLLRPKSGVIGWFALPAYVLTEWFAPVWLLLGLAFVIATSVMGILSIQAQLVLLAVVFAFTVLKMAMALILDEVSYRSYTLRDVWGLFAIGMLEQIGYRQLLSLWSLAGIFSFYFKLPIRGERRGVMSPFEAPYRPSKRRQAA
jgi:cellulose synthase/poly-beta-1,6-N-acetylglucosamine synthase-like glycosyltransferase